MALGVIRIRGNLCQYSSRAPNKAKRGKFVKCTGKKLTGKSAKRKRKAGPKSRSPGCAKVLVNQFGNKRCMRVCRTAKGKIKSQKPASGCKW